MKLYKLTDSDGNTRNGMHWDIGVTHEVTGSPRLCSGTVLHAYTSPLLAALMNPGHGAFINPRCFEVEGEIAVSDGTKIGAQKLTVVGTFVLPEVGVTQRIAFGILCALEVYKDPSFSTWALAWLDGLDRSNAAAAYAAAADAAAAAATAAAYAAYAAYAAATAAAYAAYAADAAAYAAKNLPIDFEQIARKALTII